MSIRLGLLECLEDAFSAWEVVDPDAYRARVAVGSRRHPVIFRCLPDAVGIEGPDGSSLGRIGARALDPDSFRATVQALSTHLAEREEADGAPGDSVFTVPGEDPHPAADDEPADDPVAWMADEAIDAACEEGGPGGPLLGATDDGPLVEALADWFLAADPAAFERTVTVDGRRRHLTGIARSEVTRHPRPAVEALLDGVIASRPPVDLEGRTYRPDPRRIPSRRILDRLRTAPVISPDDLEARLEAATLAERAGERLASDRPRSALAIFRAARALVPEDPGILAGIGRILVAELGRFDEGLDLLDRALEARPRSVPALRARATARAHLGDQEGARQDLRRALLLRPSDENLLSEAAAQAMGAGDEEAARSHLVRLAARAPDRASGPLVLLGPGSTGDPRWTFWEEHALHEGLLEDDDEERAARERVAIARSFDDFLDDADDLPDAVRGPLLATLASSGSPSFVEDLVARAARGGEAELADVEDACRAHPAAGLEGLNRVLDRAPRTPRELGVVARTVGELGWPDAGPALARACEAVVRAGRFGELLGTLAEAAVEVGRTEVLAPLFVALEAGSTEVLAPAVRLVLGGGEEALDAWIACRNAVGDEVGEAMDEAGRKVGLAPPATTPDDPDPAVAVVG